MVSTNADGGVPYLDVEHHPADYCDFCFEHAARPIGPISREMNGSGETNALSKLNG
jgi:hypothetical protein